MEPFANRRYVSPGSGDKLSFFDDDPNTPGQLQVLQLEPPRSAFMLFMANQAKLLQEIETTTTQNNAIVQRCASAWDRLSNQEKAQWEEVSRHDRIRYLREQRMYQGFLWKPKTRSKKHPLAPKKPMSSFLKFAQDYRSVIQKENPSLMNSDISRILGEKWRNLSHEIKSKYVMEEEQERELYKRDIAMFNLRLNHVEEQQSARHRAVGRTTRDQPDEASTVWSHTFPMRRQLIDPNHGTRIMQPKNLLADLPPASENRRTCCRNDEIHPCQSFYLYYPPQNGGRY